MPSLPSRMIANFFMEKFQQRALYRIVIFAVCFWSSHIHWTTWTTTSIPQNVNCNTERQVVYTCLSWPLTDTECQEANGIIDIQDAYPHEGLFRCQILPFHEWGGCIVPVTSTHNWNHLTRIVSELKFFYRNFIQSGCGYRHSAVSQSMS